VSLGQAQYNLGRVIGPALAGIIIAVGSYTWAFAINTLSFGAMVAALTALEVVQAPPDDTEASLWQRIRAGARGARADPGIRAAIVLISIVAITASPFIALIPAMARVRHDGGEMLTSVFVTAQGVGAVGGALIVPTLAERFGRHRVLLSGLVTLPVALVLYGAAPTPVLAAAALVAVGATYICVFSGIGTVVQLRAPSHLRARVVSLYFVAVGTLYPIAATIHGAIADRVGLGEVTAAGGLALLAAVAVLRVVGSTPLRALGDPTEAPEVTMAGPPGVVAP
jgi:MFS family permease